MTGIARNSLKGLLTLFQKQGLKWKLYFEFANIEVSHRFLFSIN